MEMATLFTHLERVSRREKPLTPIRSELSSDTHYVETDDTCNVDGCSGSMWSGHGLKICDRCSTIKERSLSGKLTAELREDRWNQFWEHRPTYHNGETLRQVGGFNHEWVESDESDTPIVDLDPEEFYRS